MTRGKKKVAKERGRPTVQLFRVGKKVPCYFAMAA